MRIGRVFGIEITIQAMWLLIFLFVTWSLSSAGGPYGALGLPHWARIGLAVLTALLFFASLLAHELAHSLLARSRGIPVRGITLFMFGGVSSFEKEPESAPSAAWISAIGPLASLVLGFLLIGMSRLFGGAPPIAVMLHYLGGANVVLAVFNLLPAFPMDGGRVLQAIVWRVTGDRARGTRAAMIVGRFFAGGLMLLGIVQASVSGDLFASLWLVVIGWFLWNAGSAEGMQSEMNAALTGHTVGELALQSAGIAPDTMADKALETMLRTGTRALPVMLGDQFLGMLSFDDLGKIQSTELPRTYVTALMTREADLAHVAPETPAMEAVQLLVKSGNAQLPVMSATGDFLGFITQETILRWIAAHRLVSGSRSR